MRRNGKVITTPPILIMQLVITNRLHIKECFTHPIIESRKPRVFQERDVHVEEQIDESLHLLMEDDLRAYEVD